MRTSRRGVGGVGNEPARVGARPPRRRDRRARQSNRLRRAHYCALSSRLSPLPGMDAFIESVRSQPCLWNPLHPDYREMHVKDEAWQYVVEQNNDRSIPNSKYLAMLTCA